MRVVVLSVCDAVDVHLVDRLASVGAVTTVRIDYVGREPARRPRWSEKLTDGRLLERADAVVRDWSAERTRHAVSRHLFGDPATPPRIETAFAVASRDVSSAATAAAIDELAPDLLFVSGAPILRGPILTLARVATINVHYGFAPHYRGENTLFWPLYLRDYGHVGVTLHRMTPALDGGPILAVGAPSTAPDDDEASLTAKCARLAADLAVELVEAARRGELEGRAQTDAGRLFRRRERRSWHDARYLASRWLRRRRLPVLPTRIERYFERRPES